MSYYGWKPYVSVAKRRASAEKAVAKARKAGAEFSPITAFSGGIAKTFWGKSWCQNLENYSDYSNRLPRGRTYVRNGSVIDLVVRAGEVKAQVMGSSLYRVEVKINEVQAAHWQAISAECAGSIDSLVELLQGKLSKAVMERISKPGDGLFPTPKEINFTCSCPDWASMCKHVAAVLYGIGARLDQQPELLFTLRRVDAKDLVNRATAGLPISTKRLKSGKVLDGVALADVFGIEMAGQTPPKKPSAIRAPVKKDASAVKPKAPLAKHAAAIKVVKKKTSPAAKVKKVTVPAPMVTTGKTTIANETAKKETSKKTATKSKAEKS